MTEVGRRIAARISAGAAMAAIAIAAAACTDLRAAADLRPLPVDPASPVAADVEKARQVSGPIPNFASIPPKPAPARPADAYRAEVVQVVADRRTLAQWEAAHPPINSDTEAFAEAERAKLAKEDAISPAQQKESEAFAQKLRQAAQAPNPK